jgi:WhiB family redox-sensing transcriptional regulator
MSDWRQDALCAQIGLDMFFPGKGESTADAKRACMACPVRVECLTEALANGERYGVWGGKSERERRRLQQDARKAGKAAA